MRSGELGGLSAKINDKVEVTSAPKEVAEKLLAARRKCRFLGAEPLGMTKAKDLLGAAKAAPFQDSVAPELTRPILRHR
jgi:hypothetical protein